MTYQTRWCPRMFREIPFVGKNQQERRHRCVDCQWILLRRRIRFLWHEWLEGR